MRNFRLLLSALALLLVMVAPAQAQTKLDFTLVNQCEWGIKAVYLAPSGTNDWGSNILSGPLNHGESLDIEFDTSLASTPKWDLKITWLNHGEVANAGDEVWTGYKLSGIKKITLFYDYKKNEAWAEEE